MEQKAIEAAAKKEGLAWRTVRRANKKIVGATALKDHDADGCWRWHPPTKH